VNEGITDTTKCERSKRSKPCLTGVWKKKRKKIKIGLTVGRDALVSQSASENERLRTGDRSVQVTIDFLVSRNGSFREQQRKEMSLRAQI
jgi:hypothetical protein